VKRITDIVKIKKNNYEHMKLRYICKCSSLFTWGYSCFKDKNKHSEITTDLCENFKCILFYSVSFLSEVKVSSSQGQKRSRRDQQFKIKLIKRKDKCARK